MNLLAFLEISSLMGDFVVPSLQPVSNIHMIDQSIDSIKQWMEELDAAADSGQIDTLTYIRCDDFLGFMLDRFLIAKKEIIKGIDVYV